MLDFLMISTRSLKKDEVEVYPSFIMKKTKDLMIRGGDFYAVWAESRNSWSTDEQDVIDMVDTTLKQWMRKHPFPEDTKVSVKYMWDAKSGSIDRWHKYCQKQMRDNFHPLDDEITFANTVTTRESYSSKRLSYNLEPCDTPAWDRIISTLYSKEERRKIEWAIGAIVTGASKRIQKFIVMYGEAGTGKSTILNIIQKIFDGYCKAFDAKALGMNNNSFALEPFKDNPLIAIQHDSDLSRIEDNTKLNSLVSHEEMSINEKHKSMYTMRFNSFLLLGTNRPVRISEAKSGLTRRLIDVSPSGITFPHAEYKKLMSQIEFELGGIAWHCKEVYESNPNYYDSYISKTMLGATNDFYNFVMDSFLSFSEDEGITLKAAWELYKAYCEETKVPYPFSQRVFKEELKCYFREFKERNYINGARIRNYYQGFRFDKFDPVKEEDIPEDNWISLEKQESVLDDFCKDCPAQYARDGDIPRKPWSKISTKLSDLNTSKVHFVKIQDDKPNHIVLDFDLKDSEGHKDLNLNIEKARKWPKTYAEVSKGGNGLHLHYLYSGDVSKLASLVEKDVEVKVYSGDGSLRRKLTLCNNLPIAVISSGLPIKKDNSMLNTNTIENEKHLRTMIKKNLRKEIHSATTPSINFIKQLLDEAYSSGIPYDVSDMYNSVLIFAMNSTNQKDNCMKALSEMKFKSEDHSDNEETREKPIAFFDIEIFPNLFLVCYKIEGTDSVIRMINPSREEVEALITDFRLVGFNNRGYDNHILYARLLGYSVQQLYELSNKIINDKTHSHTFGEAYNISYTDIYDFSTAKQSLKKWEIEMGIHHQELGLPWDKPVPEKLWPTVASYCDNDVNATEKLFYYLKSDFDARKMLAELTGMTVNDTTNKLTQRLIFGTDPFPQGSFNYVDLREQFPDYRFEWGKSYYKDEEVGEGGFVYSQPGIYRNVVTEDVASMHPHSLIAMNMFGDKYTAVFSELVEARVAAKHHDRDKLKSLFGGKLAKFAEASDDDLKNLAGALKIAINSVYGLTSAKFDNAFRDKRNVDNIVAKRGALFMATLRDKVLEQGYKVMHIKTDSIKIPDADDYILNFIVDYGKKFGYQFEVEDRYRKICLVNKAVYVAQHEDGTWTATGKQFQIPYIFKTLFSKEEITFEDLCVTNSSQTAIYLDCNEGLPDVSEYEKELRKLMSSKDESYSERISELQKLIEEGHRYQFVGKVGCFCPMKPGVGAGGLFAISKDGTKYNSVSGSKGYLWMESETVKQKHLEEWIDRSYFDKLCEKAIETIEEFGDFDKFVND